MAENNKEVDIDLSPVIKVYKDGTVERIFSPPIVPPTPEDPITGVSSKDITISPLVSARLYLPKLKHNQKLPIIVYFHGGAFCVGSAFSFLDHRYVNIVASEANAIVVSIEYRLAPEHLLPAAYEDCWVGLQWLASHSSVDNKNTDQEPWLINHGDFNKVFIAGDSAGGNIAHNIAIKAGAETLQAGLKIYGAMLLHPYFWGSKPPGSITSAEANEQSLEYRIWHFVYPSVDGGIDDPMINPTVENAPSLAGLGCSRLFVCAAEKDSLRGKILEYAEAVKKSGWNGEVEVVDVEGEEHCFQIFNPDTEKAKDLIKRMASFVMQ